MSHHPSSVIRHPPQSGFTLVEIAIVLVIIGLIISGIVVGKDLIRASQLRAVATEVGRYTQAVSDFRDKYLALPGDFAGAVALWGSPAAGCPSGASAAGDPATATCNGNGDGRITIGGTITTAAQYEQFRAWQHLANAGMIEGSYSGIQGGGAIPTDAKSQYAVIGTNVPASQLSGAGYAIISLLSADVAGSNHYFTGINYMHLLQFGAASSIATNYSTVAPILTTAEALSLDTKLDDGYPSSGKVMAPQKDSPYSGGCTNSDNVATTTIYDTTQTGYKCSLLFLLGF